MERKIQKREIKKKEESKERGKETERRIERNNQGMTDIQIKESRQQYKRE